MNSAALRTIDTEALAKTLPLPSSLDLFQSLNQFLLQWADLAPQFVSAKMEDMAPLPKEQSLFFSQPLNALLILRSMPEFEKFLNQKLMGFPQDQRRSPSELFLEMTVLFWHRLLMQFWRVDSRTLPPAILKRSVPVQWPDRKPDSSCTVFIQQFPVEVRLWKIEGEVEGKPWLLQG